MNVRQIHAYTSDAVRRLIENGVRCIEHGLLIDDATAKYLKENDVVISTQLVVYRALKDLPGITPTHLVSAKVIRMSGKPNRYGNFGEIREGWVADLLLINGEPLEDISVLRKPEKNLAHSHESGQGD